MRIVSLLPSATEIVCLLGGREQLVGVSHECDHPSGLEALPRLTRSRLELPGPCAAVDQAVRDIVASALALYELDVEQLRELRPDLIVTQDLCDVCAVSRDEVQRAVDEVLGDTAQVVSLQPLCLGDVFEDVRRVGRAMGVEDRARSAVAALEERIAALRRRAAGLARPAVLTLEWLDPCMVGGTWMPELVSAAGGTALVAEAGVKAPLLHPEQLAALRPDVILVKPCGFPLDQVKAEVPWLREHLPPAARVYLADGNAYFNRPGPRLVESLEILAACQHPETFAELARRHRESYCQLLPDGRLAPPC